MKKRISLLFFALLFTVCGIYNFSDAQDEQQVITDMIASIDAGKPVDGQPEAGGISAGEFRALQETHKLYLLIGIIAGTPFLLLLTLFFIRNSSYSSATNIVNGAGLVLVIQATVFIAVYAPTTEQLTAPIGILGAITGYLFGQADRRKTGNTDNRSESQRSASAGS